MNRSIHTFCPTCGKMVNPAPGFCTLCGNGLAHPHSPHTPQIEPQIPISLTLKQLIRDMDLAALMECTFISQHDTREMTMLVRDHDLASEILR